MSLVDHSTHQEAHGRSSWHKRQVPIWVHNLRGRPWQCRMPSAGMLGMPSLYSDLRSDGEGLRACIMVKKSVPQRIELTHRCSYNRHCYSPSCRSRSLMRSCQQSNAGHDHVPCSCCNCLISQVVVTAISPKLNPDQDLVTQVTPGDPPHGRIDILKCIRSTACLLRPYSDF